MAADPLPALLSQARIAAQNAHAPFSGNQAAAVLLLSDGTWVPGVRVESASFSLTISPALNAFTTAVASGRRDVVAAAFSRPMQRTERAFLNDVTDGTFDVNEAGDAGTRAGASLPALEEALSPFLQTERPASPDEGVALARSVAERALVPASHFPVGCVLNVGASLVPGVNVEPPAHVADWTHVLCAERSALGTACTYGLLGDAANRATKADSGPGVACYLSCPKDPAGSPCGACRQLLVELIPHAVLWMDRAPSAPERTSLPDLLPGSFRGSTLPRSAPSA